MPIIVNLDVMLARRKMRLTELSGHVGITMANLGVRRTIRYRNALSCRCREARSLH